MKRAITAIHAALLTAIGLPVIADSALDAAVIQGDAAAAEAALLAGADPDVASAPFMMTPLAVAAARGDRDVVGVLIAAGADPDAGALGALTAAIMSCRADAALVADLISAGADLESRSIDGLSPLMTAVRAGRTDVALTLISAGADVSVVNRAGDGVLNYAIYAKNPQVVQAAMDRDVPTGQLRVLFATQGYAATDFRGDDMRDLRWTRAEACAARL